MSQGPRIGFTFGQFALDGDGSRMAEGLAAARAAVIRLSWATAPAPTPKATAWLPPAVVRQAAFDRTRKGSRR